MIVNEWAGGISQFPVGIYAVRSHKHECEVCGAQPGFWCFEWRIMPGRLQSSAVPVPEHIVIARPVSEPATNDEIPIEHQAMSSGVLRSDVRFG